MKRLLIGLIVGMGALMLASGLGYAQTTTDDITLTLSSTALHDIIVTPSTVSWVDSGAVGTGALETITQVAVEGVDTQFTAITAADFTAEMQSAPAQYTSVYTLTLGGTTGYSSATDDTLTTNPVPVASITLSTGAQSVLNFSGAAGTGIHHGTLTHDLQLKKVSGERLDASVTDVITIIYVYDDGF
jgi:hypothetical protein